MIKDDIICFYFVDDIMFAFKRHKREEVKTKIKSLKKAFTIKEKDDLKWFLSMHIICNQDQKSLWLL